MIPITLAELLESESSNSGPWLNAPTTPRVGGVDPLGLRQINFDLMDAIFPGLNNVARHIRPFVLVTWAWNRSLTMAKERGLDLPVSVHEDFVARIEVAFVWSLIQQGTAGVGKADVPGYQRVGKVFGAGPVAFGSGGWKEFVQARRDSTALTAAINYGPGLRAYKWLRDDPVHAGLRIPHASALPALSAFEERMAPALSHALFNGWNACSLQIDEARAWRGLWDLPALTEQERESMRSRLVGEEAPAERRGGFLLLVQAAASGEAKEPELRRAMAGADGPAANQALLWHRLQVRQAFRLALEAMLYWIQEGLTHPRRGEDIARSFIDAAGGDPGGTGLDWLAAHRPKTDNAVDLLTAVAEALRRKQGVASAVAATLSFCLSAPVGLHDGSGREERLPLHRACRDVASRGNGEAVHFVTHIVENWVFAQHTYWSVGRGLADARSASPILRLRVALEKEGWNLTRGGGPRAPRATPDRLQTAIELAREAGLVPMPAPTGPIGP